MKPTTVDSDSGKGRWWLIFPLSAFLLLLLFFIFYGTKPPVSPEPIQPLEPTWITPKTARAQILENKTLVGNCFICHMVYAPDPGVVQPEFTHQVIKLDHGNCNRCFNCHLISDRNKYVANDGSGIMPANVEKLCARCHGLIYNDWLIGTHGVWRGKWSAKTTFDRETFTCTQCHDPHSPRYQFKEFAPPPIWPDKFVRRSAEEYEKMMTAKHLEPAKGVF